MANTNLQYVFLGLTVALALWGYAERARRIALWAGALCAAAAALGAHYESFWTTACFAALLLWACIAATPVVDASWRARCGLVVSVVFIAGLTFWPTLSNMTGGRLPVPAYVSEGVTSRLVAGLDLRGGLRLVYTVDVDEAIKDRRDRLYDDMRAELTRLFELHSGDERPSEEALTKLRDVVEVAPDKHNVHLLALTIKDPQRAAKVDTEFLNRFAGEMSFTKDAAGLAYVFRMREQIATEIRDTAVRQARQIVSRRVDQLGLREAAVSTRDEDIIVEVPGQDEASFDQIREIIGQTARLEFKLVDDESDYFTQLERDSRTSKTLPDGLEFARETTSVGQDADGEELRKQVTYVLLNIQKDETRQATLKRFKAWVETLDLPPDREVGFELVHEVDEASLEEREVGWRTYLVKSRTEITGDLIRDAQRVPDTSPRSVGGWYVRLTFTDTGGSLFERITASNIKRRFAIILDDRIESAPVIQDRIGGGVASITLGSRDPQTQLLEARKLELVLRSGALPAPITPSNEQHIGPSLGRTSINLGVRGGAVGGSIVLLFMVLYYRRAGMVANVAVSLNLFLQMAILTSFDASMTLPGIAGLALTIGMSVDSNVLINERIREELRANKSPRAAVEIGFSKALSAIVDGHVTTLISAVVLAQFGTGPIRGFAITLIVGVACSIFTGVVVSRLLFDLWVKGMGRTAKLDVG